MKEAHIRPAREHLRALTGLRFIAAALVLMHHAQGAFGLPPDSIPGPLTAGVSFFFVLSGFILTHVYPSLGAPGAARAFWLARFARIWPLHAACLIVAVAIYGYRVHPVGNPTAITALVANLFLVHAWVPYPEFFFSGNVVSWSVSTEAFFYLIFPTVILSFARTWWWKLALSFGLLGTLVLACAVFDIGQVGRITSAALIYINPLGRVFEFVLGMTACLAWRRFGALLPRSMPALTLLELSALVVVALTIAQRGPMAALAAQYLGRGGVEWVGHSGLCLSFALLVFVFASGHGALGMLLSSVPMVFLGEISFAVYMTHHLVLNAFVENARILAAVPQWMHFPIFLLAVGLISWQSWRFEKFAKNIVLRRFGARPVWEADPVAKTGLLRAGTRLDLRSSAPVAANSNR